MLERVVSGGLSLERAAEEADRREGRLARLWPPPGSADDAFAYAMARAALRRLGHIDALLASRLRKPPPPKVLNILRIGAAQLLFLNTPPHAAVHSAVEQVGASRALKPFRSLVNALLRRCADDGRRWLAELPARANLPAALRASWEEAYGIERTERMAAVQCQEPPLDLQFRVPQEAALWRERLGGTELPGGGARLFAPGAVSQLPGFDEGAWWVQDAAAALPVRLFGEEMEGQAALDLCAAPGGKTAQLLARGAKVTAVERSGARLQILRGNLRRLGFDAEVVEADARVWKPPQPVRYVLLDAPCSANGTLRRNPDVAWRGGRDWRDGGSFLAPLLVLQRQLLAAAAAMVAPGGVLVYGVCSLQPCESEAQVEAFLRTNPEFRRVPVDAGTLGGLSECVSPHGDMRALPCHLQEIGGMDGFYAARLHRRG